MGPDLNISKSVRLPDSVSSTNNALPVNGRVIFPEAFPRTREKLERHGCRVVGVALDELAKAEGAVTCCSLVFEVG